MALCYLAGCDTTSSGDGLPAAIDCHSCHGSTDNPAPPPDLDGSSDTAEITVGAHQAHLHDGPIRAAIQCDQCHVVPDQVDAPGHVDPGPAEVVFGTLAEAAGLEPSWDRDDARCYSTYCHGGSLAGGQDTDPLWTLVDGSQIACDSCHGAPPPPPHPASGVCHDCHSQTVQTDGRIDLASGTHINGELNLDGLGCSACHGSAENPAPPLALDGASDPSDPGVGAHQAHLHDSRLRRAIACDECHLVPATVDAPGHIEPGLPAELTWGSLATTGGLSPAWVPAELRCASTYCHGASLTGGQDTEPVWNVVDGSQVTCDSCHGAPPPLPHPERDDCHTCHPGTVAADGSIEVEGELHIDGQVEYSPQTCSACHGSDVNPAPPTAIDGSSSTSDPQVGAHQSHMRDGPLRQAIACDECHVVPATVDAPGHLGPGPAEVEFGPLATTDGLAPAWDPADNRCSNTYCHGASLPGGSLTDPDWIVVDGSQAACGTCHGAPPPPPHPLSPHCQSCHPATVGPDGRIDTAGGKHIDGQLEVIALACNSCHGNDVNAAPPLSVTGQSQTTAIGVGAHQSHLRDSNIRQAIACDECHVVPTELDHATGLPAPVTFGSLASTGGLDPIWDRDQATCSDTYCHGASLTGGQVTAPLWTAVDAGQATCVSCHGFPPPAPHPDSLDCQACHPATILGGFLIDVAGGKHIDGQVEVSRRGG